VAQRFALYGELSSLENLRLQAGLYGLTGRRREERIRWALERLDLEEAAQTATGELPLGFQRRLALAAALLHEPEVLFLDEPTSGVDPLARQRFWELIYELAESGMGILVTTHYMDEALFCDRLSLMMAGRVVEEGSPAELLARPLATPLLLLRSEHCGACAAELAAWDTVREVVPHAGSLRIRLEQGADREHVLDELRTWAGRNRVPVEAIEPAEPELEDIFVAVLERAGQEGP
jgi:ABC-2 type transport system ATP-binding protein